MRPAFAHGFANKVVRMGCQFSVDTAAGSPSLLSENESVLRRISSAMMGRRTTDPPPETDPRDDSLNPARRSTIPFGTMDVRGAEVGTLDSARQEAHLGAAMAISAMAERMEQAPAHARTPAPCAVEQARKRFASNWDFYDGGQIDELLNHTPLIDLQWLCFLARDGGAVPRHQDVPSAAKITQSNAWRIKLWGAQRPKFSLGVLVLSYPWGSPEHPDKEGMQLKRMLPIFEAMLQEARCDSEFATVGVLMDFLCLPQRPFGNDEEKERFTRSLREINRWYFHKATFGAWVLLLSDVPRSLASQNSHTSHAYMSACLRAVLLCTDSLPQSGDSKSRSSLAQKYTNRRPYDKRG